MIETPEMGRPVPGPGSHAGGDSSYVLEPSPRRVRVRFGAEFVADSRAVRLLFESGRLPVYYFPAGDVRFDRLEEAGTAERDPVKGPTTRYDVVTGERRAPRAAWCCRGDPSRGPPLADLVAFEWRAMDAWYEEDDEVFVHPRDPYHRVDVAQSSRHVQVSAGGIVLADSRRPLLLFETGLPTRYYLPKMDVRLERLEASATRTGCPYKGEARYFSVCAEGLRVEDAVWCYETPVPEMPRIAGHLSFFNEKVDIVVDGEILERPCTQWS